MNRNLTAERLYSIRQYENIKLTDTIEDLPDEIALDPGWVNDLRYLQFVELELSYRRYLDLIKNLNSLDLDNSLAFLEQEKTNTIDTIRNKFDEMKGEK